MIKAKERKGSDIKYLNNLKKDIQLVLEALLTIKVSGSDVMTLSNILGYLQQMSEKEYEANNGGTPSILENTVQEGG